MGRPAEQLVGRAAELGTLEEALAGLQRGKPGALEIVGEPGIGKTRLLAELGTLAEASGRLVLSGSASELEGDVPFWVFVDALDDHVRELDHGRLAELGEEVGAELPHVLPSLPAAGRPAPALPIERYRSHRAVRRLLEALAATSPLVLLLDDLHWADSGAIELLGALLRRPPAGPVLLALAMRPRQVPERLAGALERARRAGTVTTIALEPLDAEQTRELLGDAVPGAEADVLHAETGGNPFYVQELARYAGERAPGADVPRSVVAALGDELARLDDDARLVLQGAAVTGDPFELELAAAAAGVPDASAVCALDGLLRRDLVRPTDVPRRFRFRHPLVRHAVYQGTPAGWRLGAHDRTAAALADRGAPAAVRAHHVEQAARHGDRTAIALLREAGETTAQRTPAGAARWFAAALRILPADAPPPERIDLLTALAGAQAATGRFDEARGSLLGAIRVAHAEPAGRRARLVTACAALEHVLGRPEEARARLEAALADANGPAAAALMIDLGVGAFYAMDWERSRRWADRALDVVRPLGDGPLTAAAAATAACALAYAGAGAEAEAYGDEAAALVDAMSDAELAIRLDAAAQLAGAETYLGRIPEGLAHAQRGLAVARASGQGELFPVLIPALIGALFMQGRLLEADELLDGAIEGARLAGNVQPLAWYLLSQASVQMLRGDVDEALRTAEESVELCRTLRVNVVSSYADEILGLVQIEAGETEQGVAALVAGGGGESLPRSPGAWRAWDLDRLVQGLLALGRRREAEEAAAHAEAAAGRIGRDFGAAAAARARARVVLAAGDAAGAAELALASAAVAERAGAVVEAAISRLLAGRALRQAGEQERAIALLERAAAELDARGAARHRDEAERELRRLGHARHRRTRAGRRDGAGVESLTGRELQVARLVVDRKTNAQIAAELFLSPKTVETHIRNLFHKLGVSSRVEVARVVEAADRTPGGAAGHSRPALRDTT